MREIDTAARALGLQQHLAIVRDPGDFDNAFANLTAARPDAIFVPIDSMFYQHRARLAQLAAKTRLPAMWGAREFAEAGGLMSYYTDLDDLGRRAACSSTGSSGAPGPPIFPSSSRRSSSSSSTRRRRRPSV
jgi:putative ABC transport system substrate-binding protein